MSNPTYQCSSCGKHKRLNHYYSSVSPIHKHYGIVTICKGCLSKMVNPINIRTVLDALRMIDRPFIEDLWMASIEEAERNNSQNIFGIYMKNVNMEQYRDWNWEDSTHDSDIESIGEKTGMSFAPEVLTRWRGWEPHDIEILEEMYQDLRASYQDDSPIQRSIYRNLAVAQHQADQAIAEGKSNDYKKFMDVIRNLMDDGRLTPRQNKGVDDEGLNTWGEW